jgi:hypothetical protein
MSDDASRDNFTYLSNEYAQALQAFSTIQEKASTLLLLGGSDDLLSFIEQFIAMAARTKAMAEDMREPNFAEWFGELVEKAEALRAAVPQR